VHTFQLLSDKEQSRLCLINLRLTSPAKPERLLVEYFVAAIPIRSILITLLKNINIKTVCTWVLTQAKSVQSSWETTIA
jgi:hypothetical protein